MLPDERNYRALVVSSSARFNDVVIPLLLAANCPGANCVGNIAAAKRAILEVHYDFVIINAPLPDDFGTSFAIDICADKTAVCLLFVHSEHYEEIRARVIDRGVFILPKPTSPTAVIRGLDFMTATCERLRNLGKKTVTIEEKMEEIRLVNRAKWLLIENLQMTEPDAHRYIAKQAMDRCVSKREIAADIIKTYT